MMTVLFHSVLHSSFVMAGSDAKSALYIHQLFVGIVLYIHFTFYIIYINYMYINFSLFVYGYNLHPVGDFFILLGLGLGVGVWVWSGGREEKGRSLFALSPSD